MKLYIIATLVTLLTTVASELVLDHSLQIYESSEIYHGTKDYPYKNLGVAGDPTPEPSDPPPKTPDTNTPYGKAWCKGARLNLGMTLDTEGAKKHITPMPSPWNGNLIAEMKLWGYMDDSDNSDTDSECDFDRIDGLETAFEALGISPDSRSQGGPNRCFRATHQNGPAIIRGPPPDHKLPPPREQKYVVGEKKYRVTGAGYTIGVNAEDGVVYFIDMLSPRFAAMDLWETENPPAEELPALQASSDMAWGFYNRAMKSKKKPLNQIKKFMSVTVINQATKSVINQAVSQLKPIEGKPPLRRAPAWPGVEFETSTEEGLALLGTANGIAVGYFLAQHKAQLGLKHVSKITVFTNDDLPEGHPNMLFWVEDVPPPEEKPKDDPMDTGPGSVANIAMHRVVKRSKDGGNFVREHIFYARL